MVASAPPAPPSRVAGLASAVADLAAENPRTRPDASLGDDLVALRRQIDLLESEFSRRLALFDTRRGYAAEGAGSTVSWLRSHCRLSGQAAAQHVDVARRLEQLPDTRTAFRHGDVAYQHVAAITRVAGDVGTAAVRRAEPSLLQSAARLDPGQFRMVTRALHHAVDPAGALDAENANHRRRWLHLSQTHDGLYTVEGLLTAEGGAIVRTAIDALLSPRRDDERNPGQRRHDALVELATRHLHAGTLPSSGGQRPHLTITAPASSLAHGSPPGSPRTHGSPLKPHVRPALASDAFRAHGAAAPDPATLHHAGPMTTETLERLTCDAALTRMTIDADGAPLDVGRATRTIPPAIRRALVQRDRGCRFPGCDRPPEWTDAHHLYHWSHGGKTSLDNLVSLCRHHHRCVHEDGWRLRREPDGTLSAVPPSRKRVTAPP